MCAMHPLLSTSANTCTEIHRWRSNFCWYYRSVIILIHKLNKFRDLMGLTINPKSHGFPTDVETELLWNSRIIKFNRQTNLNILLLDNWRFEARLRNQELNRNSKINIWANENKTPAMYVKLLLCSTLLYGVEAWTLEEITIKRLKSLKYVYIKQCSKWK